jgi:hypothetical protein
LTSITCFPHDSWASYPPHPEPGFNILSSILKAFLEHSGSSETSTLHANNDVGYEDSNGVSDRSFVWDDKYKLKRVSVRYKTWDIATKFFGKGEKGTKKPEKMESKDGKRQVWFRDVTGASPVRIHVGYDPEFTWMEKVDGL